MSTRLQPIPGGYRSVTPLLTVRNASEMIEFYKKAFGAQERFRMSSPDGKWIVHAELKIGDLIFMLGEEMPGQECHSPVSVGGAAVGFYVYVDDVDSAFKRAVDAGATVKKPLEDMFWGDRIGEVSDPSGHVWTLATHMADISSEEIERRGREAFEKMATEMAHA